MRRITTTATTVAGTLLALGLWPTAPSTAAPAAQTGCPGAFDVLSLDDLVAAGYVFAPDLDANEDGRICGKPMNPVVQERLCLTFPGGVCPVPVLYTVRDNDLASR